ncbi:MAG TPA: ABC transporter permease [Solirubrobacteraceae bacterium]|nr:ABC transporter permease [Solirubrobacteraceae bacterium]
MLRVVGKRLVVAIPLIVAVASISFLFLQITPGSPASVILGTRATPEGIRELDHKLGLDQPLPTQYGDYLSELVHGTLGHSLLNGQSVTGLLASRLQVTLSLAILATLVSAVVGMWLGTFVATRRGWYDRVLTPVSGLGLAMPSFWLGTLLVLLLAIHTHALPATGYVPIERSVVQWAYHLVLPVVALSAALVAAIARQTRVAMIEELGRDYVRALRAAGVPRRSIVWRHALRNASIPVVTTLGLQFVGVLGGAVIIEQVFSLPGVGSLVLQAANSHDVPVVQGVVVASAVVVLVVNLVLDLVLMALSPKVRRA